MPSRTVRDFGLWASLADKPDEAARSELQGPIRGWRAGGLIQMFGASLEKQ